MTLGGIGGWQTAGIIALVALWVAAALIVITDEREPGDTLAWLLVLGIVPVVGPVLYYFFGRNPRRSVIKDPRRAEIAALAAPVMRRIRERYAGAHAEAVAWADERGYSRVLDLVVRTEGVTVLPAYDVDLFFDGASKFSALKEDIAAATETVDLQYFMWSRDWLTAEVTAVLLERLAAGIEVRILYDIMGSLPFRKDEIRRLRAAGAGVRAVWRPRNIFYRDHRKIAVIDGTVGYTGGLNVGRRYVDGVRAHPGWRDTHVRFHGPAVADLQKLFAMSWRARTGEDLFSERFFPHDYPETGRRSLVQVVSTAADELWEPARRAYVASFSAANRRVWIESPDYVPTPEAHAAVVEAALSGLDVRLMITGWTDRLVYGWATEWYLRPLLDAGVTIYRQRDGCMHAKTLTIDDEFVVIGSMNLDVRSLSMHQEDAVWFYDPEVVHRNEEAFLRDVEACDLVTRETVDAWSEARRIRSAAARLVSTLA